MDMSYKYCIKVVLHQLKWPINKKMSNTKGIIAETQSSLEEGLLNSAKQPSNRILTPYNGSVALFPYITTGLHHV